MQTKKCRACGEIKDATDFYKLKNGCSLGLMGRCKSCHIKTTNKYYRENKDEVSKKAAERYAAGAREKKLNYMKEYTSRSTVAKKRKQYIKKYYEENYHVIAEAVRRRNLAKEKRTPAWLTEDHKFMMQEIYSISKLRSEMTGIEHHVDHIVPLRGRNVSGLHVPWNLQVITAHENRAKHNKFEST